MSATLFFRSRMMCMSMGMCMPSAARPRRSAL